MRHAVQLILIVAGCAACVGCDWGNDTGARFVRKIEWTGRGVWLKVDTHIHSKFSDGSHSVSEIAYRATKHGCDAIAITDHADRDLQAASPEYAEAIVVARRQHPHLLILAGLEWNIPPWDGDEHATVIVPPGADEFLRLLEFKTRFDDLGRDRHSQLIADAALRWLEESAIEAGASPLVLYNHPARKNSSSLALVERLQHWRAVNDIVIGFSGAPGHQRGQLLGAYDGAVSVDDRWDPAVNPGDAWDILLREGDDVWGARAASDFHNNRGVVVSDYWPGEFSETWLAAPDRTVSGVLKAFRAGTFFAGHGHIAREVELRVTTEGLERPAEVGESIEVAAGSTIVIELTAIVPEKDWEGTANRIDTVEIFLVRPTGTEVVEFHPQPARELKVQTVIEYSGTEDLVVRARGRRRVEDGPDLLFYTNPIRVVGRDAKPRWIAVWQSLTSQSELYALLRRILGAVVLALALFSAARFAWSRRKSGRDAVSGTDHAEPPNYSPASSSPPRAFHYVIAAGLFTLFAIYGSLVPLNFRQIPWEQAYSRFQHLPYWELGIEHRADWVANILLFVPIGFCWLAVPSVDRRRGVNTFVWTMIVAVGCAALSIALEFTQIFFPPRTTSFNDIVAEIIGGLIGCVLWLACGQRATGWMRNYTRDLLRSTQLDWLLQAYAVGLVVYSLLPFDVTIHPVEIYRKLRDGRIALLPFSGTELSFDSFWGHCIYVLSFVPIGVLVVRMRRQLPIPYSVAIGTVFVAVIEISQIFIYTRFAKTTDVIIGALGIWIGVLWARRSTTLPTTTAAHAGGALSNCLWTLGVLFYSAFLCTTFWWPLEMIDDRQLILTRLEGFWRVPFAALYRGSEFNAATQLVRKLLHFALLGAAVGHLVQRFSLPGYARRWWYLISACYGIGLGVMIELGQVFFPPHVCDVTDVLIYSCGVIVGMRVCIRFQRGSSGQGPNFVLRSRAPSSRQNDTRRHPVTKALTLGGVLLLVCFVAWGTMRVVMTNRDKINISFEDSVGAVLYRQPSVQSSPEAEHDRKSISAHISDAFDGRSTSYEISAKWPAIGVQGPIGCDSKPKKVQRLIINKPGVYENHLVDGDGSNRTLVKISADGVILRHCEIRNGTHNAVTVYADNVMIESCRIHHVFKGTFQKQRDAHGITGRPTNLIIRNCEIYQLSGDGIQFDPDRGPWDRVLVENCTIWTAPLDADAAGFKRGERPGENGVDTKQRKSNPRSRMFIRNCVFYGWGEGQIANQAALNLKDNVDVRVENCAFRNNDICFRLRGEASARRGGALVTIQRCAVYDSLLAARMEDRISHLKIRRLGIGDGVRQKYYIDKGKIGPGYENTGEFKPPTFEAVIRDGVPAATRRYPAKDR